MSNGKLRTCIILTLAWLPVAAAPPPAWLARKVAASESAAMEAREHYTYRQEVLLEEYDSRGTPSGRYAETRDIIFAPGGKRMEVFVRRPHDSLRRIRLTEEDFQDIRSVQPFLFTQDLLWLYETRVRGEESVDGIACWVLDVRPRQTLDGMRLFEGTFWVDQQDFTVVRTFGRAVPQILRRKAENLFPRFTTLRERIDGRYRFPVHTLADDTLPFSSGPQRVRMSIRYLNYKRFQADSTVTFETPQ